MSSIPKEPATLDHFTIELKKAEISEKNQKILNDTDKILIEKIEALRHVLAETTTDKDAPSYTEGNKYIPILDEGEVQIVKDKLFELIKQL